MSFRGARILFHSNVKAMVYVINIVAQKRPIESCLIYWNKKKKKYNQIPSTIFSIYVSENGQNLAYLCSK